eukprot:905429-Karenia_brevis.AAC.1
MSVNEFQCNACLRHRKPIVRHRSSATTEILSKLVKEHFPDIKATENLEENSDESEEECEDEESEDESNEESD